MFPSIQLAREETQLLSQHNEADLVERATYESFTGQLRYLHAEERNYDSRMRQWALIGSVTIAITSAFVTWLRFRTPYPVRLLYLTWTSFIREFGCCIS